MNEAISEMGMVTRTMTVARQRPKNTNTTIPTNNNANSTVSTSEPMVLRMLSLVSTM